MNNITSTRGVVVNIKMNNITAMCGVVVNIKMNNNNTYAKGGV